MLLRKLEDDHKFYIVDELVGIFKGNKAMIAPITEKMFKNQADGYNLDFGMNEEELEIFKDISKTQLTILVRLLAYCYPKLKATEINTGSGDKIVFNISGLDVAATRE
jgi:hypothetical protein